MSKAPDDQLQATEQEGSVHPSQQAEQPHVNQLQATEQEGSVHPSQQAEQPHVNTADQFSKTELTEGSKSEQPVQVEQQNSHLQQAHQEIQLQQAETNSYQLAEKETGSFGQQSFAGTKVDVTQPSVVQQNVKQTVGQQASSGAQDTRKGPSIPFNMLIPILQAHLDRDKDMQLQAVWAKLRRNEVHKDDFLRVIRNIVGDQMLKQAAHKVFVQMQAQAQRNSQANPSQQSLFSQVSAQQMPSSGSAQLHDQKLRAPGPPNQGQKNQVSSSHQAFAPPSGTQAQNSVHYLAHDNPNQNPDAKGTNVVPNQPPRMTAAVPLQTKNKQHQATQLQQTSQQIYGASNPGAQAYPRSITGSLRSPSPVPETQPSMHAPGVAPAKIVPPPTHPMMQHNAVAWQMHQNKELKTNAPPPNANAKQNSESVGKARMAGTGNSSAKGKQGTPNSTPNASGGAKSSKKSGGQKKSLDAAGSTQPSSKKQKTSGAFQEQSIDQLNDVTAVSGVNIREEEEQLLSAPKEESLASQEARRIAQEEEENLFLRKGPLLKKLAEIARKCDLKNISGDVEHCLSMCVEERLRRLINTLIRVSKQRIDTEKTGHQLVITSDVGRQILQMNQKAKEEWDKKHAEEADKNKKQTEADGSGATELEKEKEESRPKNVKPNKEEDDKMRTNAANVAARQAVGGSDMLSKWQLMAEQARQKREGLNVSAASQPGRGPGSRPLSQFGKGPGEHQEGSKRSHSVAFGTGGMKRPGRTPFAGPQRMISVKDVICALEREPQMTKSRLIYRLHERLPADSAVDYLLVNHAGAAGRQPIGVRPDPEDWRNPAAGLLPRGGPAWPGRRPERAARLPGAAEVRQHERSRVSPREERRGSFHGRAGVSEKRAPPSLVLVCCIGAIALLAGASRTLAPKEELCLGSFGCIHLTPVGRKLQGVKYELYTLPVDAKAVTDGDTITVYVPMAHHPESSNVPQEVREAGIEQSKALAANNYQRAGDLLKIILDAGYRQVCGIGGEQILAKKYRIRLRGVDAPESLMPYGKEAKEELVKLVQGKSLKISIYDTDWYGRLVGDVDCDGVFVQEHMLKKGLAWHYTTYDHRMELSKWENQAKTSGTGLWASSNPEKPWEWRKKKRTGTV